MALCVTLTVLQSIVLDVATEHGALPLERKTGLTTQQIQNRRRILRIFDNASS